MQTVCQFFYYTPSHRLQSLLRLPYTLVTDRRAAIVHHKPNALPYGARLGKFLDSFQTGCLLDQ